MNEVSPENGSQGVALLALLSAVPCHLLAREITVHKERALHQVLIIIWFCMEKRACKSALNLSLFCVSVPDARWEVQSRLLTCT